MVDVHQSLRRSQLLSSSRCERERAALLAIKYRDQKRIVTDEAALTSKREDVNVMRISSGRFGLELAGTLAEARRQHVRRHKC